MLVNSIGQGSEIGTSLGALILKAFGYFSQLVDLRVMCTGKLGEGGDVFLHVVSALICEPTSFEGLIGDVLRIGDRSSGSGCNVVLIRNELRGGIENC